MSYSRFHFFSVQRPCLFNPFHCPNQVCANLQFGKMGFSRLRFSAQENVTKRQLDLYNFITHVCAGTRSNKGGKSTHPHYDGLGESRVAKKAHCFAVTAKFSLPLKTWHSKMLSILIWKICSCCKVFNGDWQLCPFSHYGSLANSTRIPPPHTFPGRFFSDMMGPGSHYTNKREQKWYLGSS